MAKKNAEKVRLEEVCRRIANEIAGADDIGKTVAFPNARTLSDVFTVVTHFDITREQRDTPTIRTFKIEPGKGVEDPGEARIDGFCSVRGKPYSMIVVPKKEVVDFIAENMLLSDGYRITFQITVRDSGTALVTAHYNMIIGSRWLAIIDAASLP